MAILEMFVLLIGYTCTQQAHMLLELFEEEWKTWWEWEKRKTPFMVVVDNIGLAVFLFEIDAGILVKDL